VVAFNDLVVLAQHYNTTLTGDNWWTSGDFTLDGKVDFNDLVRLAQNYNTALNGAPVPADLAADWSVALAAVPEPSSTLGWLTLALLPRGRRRR
jgi:hypothetical protein